jgi:hypothetical protein
MAVKVGLYVIARPSPLKSTPRRGGRQPAQHLTADVTGVRELTLDVGDAGYGGGPDNSDWADAQFQCSG